MSPSRQWLSISVAAATLALGTAACGSSAAGPSASSNPQFERSRCMREHGVPNFPDPTVGPGGDVGLSVAETPGSETITIGGIQFSGPAFQSALTTCQFFGGRDARRGISEAARQAMIANAACIRRHGVPGFPDPSFGPAGRGVGVELGPGLNPDSPAIRSAARACEHVGAPIPGVGDG